MARDLLEPLLLKPRGHVASKVRSWVGVHGVPAAVALLCVGVGVLHPLAAEAAKSARATTCRARPGGLDCSAEGAPPSPRDGARGDGRRRVMPFYAVSLTITSELTSMVVAGLAVAYCEGSFARAARILLQPKSVLRLWPIGAAYGVGDLMQAFACNSASAPVVLVIGQCKLMLTAVLSMLVLGSRTPAQWGHLLTISFAAIAGAHQGATKALTEMAQASEIRGALLALLKAALSTSGAVFSERFFKERGESFWTMSFRVQSMMLATSLMMFAGRVGGEGPTSPTDFFRGGPVPLCAAPTPCEPGLAGECQCIDHLGWDRMTVLSMSAMFLNGVVTGLTLKYLSAVGKAICNALSVAVFYPAYVLLGFKPFDLTQAAIIAVIIVSSYQYTIEKANHSRAQFREVLPLAARRPKAGTGCGGA